MISCLTCNDRKRGPSALAGIGSDQQRSTQTVYWPLNHPVSPAPGASPAYAASRAQKRAFTPVGLLFADSGAISPWPRCAEVAHGFCGASVDGYCIGGWGDPNDPYCHG